MWTIRYDATHGGIQSVELLVVLGPKLWKQYIGIALFRDSRMKSVQYPGISGSMGF